MPHAMQEIQSGAASRAFVIGVAGGTGSGKTTVSRRIWETVGRERIAYLQHDNYYKDQSQLTPEERARTNYDHPDSLETSLMVRHLRELRAGRPVDIPVYDFTMDNRSKETLRVNPAKVILVEGILIFAEPDLCELMDMRIFVDTDADIRFIRRLRRDIVERGRSLESVVKQYLGTVRPMHLEFVEPSKRYADIIVPQGGDNRVAMEMIVSRIQALLSDA
ncbi:uridine kinase [Caldilinea sp.]|uniref:uridine kinase n=1 Tax=Caldilinea sp. TaxID=2293560 RepID=UPI002C2983E3|nr:uridine kinase [Caldilinea sp.]